jgi:hypothetical protein
MGEATPLRKFLDVVEKGSSAPHESVEVPHRHRFAGSSVESEIESTR